MSPHHFDPERDLRIHRVMHAPKERVWRAWTDPELLQKWWVPAPTVARIERFDPTVGGAFVTQMSEDGENFVPHTDGTDYLAIVRYADPQARAKHEELGFYEGWGAVTEALANLSEPL